MASVTFDDDPDRPAPAAPSGIPRITVTPAPRAIDFNDDPDRPPPSRSRASDRVRELIVEQSKMGWPAWLNQGAGDFTAAGADMASFGNRPRLDAATGALTGTYPDYSTGLDEELKQARTRAERSPIANMLGNVAGGVAGGVGAGVTKVGANIAGRVMPYAPAWLAKSLGFGTEAGLVGGTQAAGHTYTGNPADYVRQGFEGFATAAPVGAALGPLTPTSAVRMRPGDPRTGQPIREPTNAELLARSDNGYQTLARIPVTYPGSHLQGTLSAAESQMITQNVAPEQARTVFSIIERIRQHPGSISPAQVDNWRQSLNNMKNVPTPGAEKAGVAAAILRDSLDDMIKNGAQASSNPVLGQQAAQWVTQARADRAAMFRSQRLTDLLANATMKADRGGPSVGDQLGAKADKLLEWKGGKQPNARGTIPEERAAIAAAVVPTLAERGAKIAGTAAPWLGGAAGGGLGGTGGAVVGNIPGAVGGGLTGTAIGTGAGLALKRALEGFSSRGIQSRWEDAAAQMRQRSPSYQRAIQGSVPVAGPGQGWLPQSLQGAGASQFATPYDDGRDALAAAALKGLMQ